jgi:hypothetical protein
MTYIVLLVFPDGDKNWIDFKSETAAKESLRFHVELGAIGTIIATKKYDKSACFF